MTSYEFTGKSVKEAIAKACEELNTDEALLEIDVLEESTRGFLGIVGHRDARVRVRRRDILKEVIEATDERAEDKPDTQPRHEELPEKSADEQPVADQEPGIQEPEEPEEEEEEPPASSVDPSPYVDEARRVLQDILDRIPVSATVEASTSNGAVYLDIRGDGSGLLIGKKGQTLDALQFLVNKIINKSNPTGLKVEIIVDTENYRVRKRENLRETAVKMSEKAKRTLKPVSLNPMPAHERRIIHLILAQDKEVYTKSYGDGPMRRIIIYPRRAMASKRRRR